MAVANPYHKDLHKRYDPGRLPDWILWADIKHHARSLSGTFYGPLHLSLFKARDFWFNFFEATTFTPDRVNMMIKQFAITYHYYIRYPSEYMLTDLRILNTQLTPNFDPLINFFAFCRGIEARKTTGQWWLVKPNDGQVNMHDYFRLLFFLSVALEEEGIYSEHTDLQMSTGYWGQMGFVHAFITGASKYVKNIQLLENLYLAVYSELSEDVVPANLSSKIIEAFLRARPALVEDFASCLNINVGEVDFVKYLSTNIVTSYQLGRCASRTPLPNWILDKIVYPKIYSLEEF